MYWITASRLTRLIGLCAAAALCCLSMPANAQLQRAAQSIDISVAIGFQQRVQLDKWTPITVTVRNAGPAVTGYLEVLAEDSRERNEYQTRYRQAVELTKGAQKRFQFTVYISRIAQPLHIRVVTGAGQVAEQIIDLRSKLTQQRFIVVLARDVNLDYLNDQQEHRAQVVYPLPSFLPTHWQGYDGVEAVVLHRYALRELTPRQYAALQKWIASGGTLLISGGYDTAILRTPRIAQLLPTRVIGTQQLPPPSPLHNALGERQHSLVLAEPLGIAKVDDADAYTVHHLDNIPLVLRRKYGQGAVILLTFDLASNPFPTWPGMRSFMIRMLHLSAIKPIALAQRRASSVAPAPLLTQLTGQRAFDYPGHATIIAFVAFYLVVLALFAHQRDGRSFYGRYLIAFAVPIAFALGAIVLFHRVLFPQSPTLAAVTVIEPLADSAFARLKLRLRVHSTLAQPLAIDYGGATPALRAVSVPVPNKQRNKTDEDTTVATWIFEQGTQSSARPLTPQTYTVYSAEGTDIVNFSVRSSFRRTDDAAVEFHNSSGRNITQLWAITRRDVFALGAVADGQTINAPLTQVTGMPRERYAWRDAVQDANAGSDLPVAAIEAILRGEFGAQFGRGSDTDTSVLLIGFTTNPWTVHTESPWDRIDLTMMVWRIQQHGDQP